MRHTILIAAALLLWSAAARADDFHLKDGSTISGSIVGYDDASFEVQTSYGYALVRKDQVVSITIADGSKNDADKAASAVKAGPATHASAAQAPTTNKSESVASLPPAAPAPRGAVMAPVVAAPNVSMPAATSSNALASIATVPSAPPNPGPIREEVNGSTYVNESYGFRMYKPPDWEVIEGARSLLPGAVTAMGTNDQTTYLLIGEAPAGKSVASDIDATDQRLRSVMDNFRPLGESRVNVAGTQAIERRFRGSVDQKDWSGTVVFLAHGGELYTIFGMTLAETDLVQIQENVIARAISSLQFVQ